MSVEMNLIYSKGDMITVTSFHLTYIDKDGTSRTTTKTLKSPVVMGIGDTLELKYNLTVVPEES